MKKSYSLLGSDHLNLLKHLNEKENKFDSLHFDLIDESYCGGLGLSVLTLEQLCELKRFKIDVHILMKNHKDITERIKNLELVNINYHIEHMDVDCFKEIDLKYAEKGIAVGLDHNLSQIAELINHTKSILLLCMRPSLNLDNKYDDALLRVKEFRKLFPKYNGELIVDGGFDKNDLVELEKHKISKVVIGSSFIN